MEIQNVNLIGKAVVSHDYINEHMKPYNWAIMSTILEKVMRYNSEPQSFEMFIHNLDFNSDMKITCIDDSRIVITYASQFRIFVDLIK